MKKNHIAIMLACGVIFSAAAQSNTVEFTYANTDLASFGKGKVETYDVAMCIQDPALVGMQITGFRAYINTVDGVSNTSMFLTDTLQVKSKLNAPTIGSYEVAPVPTDGGLLGEIGLLQVKLDEPYVITEKPVYVGYSMDVDNVSTTALQYPVLVAQGTNPNGMFVHMSKSALKWVNWTQQVADAAISYGHGIAYIVVEIEGDFPEYSLGFKSYEDIYAEPNTEYPVLFQVANVGANSITSLNYTYTYNDDPTEYTGSVTLPSPIESAIALTTPLELTFNGLPDYGANILNVTISEVNGQKNEAPDASMACTVNVIPYHPVNRPLIEEGTGLWCQWCPRGWLAMEMINEDYGDKVVLISYHSGDEINQSSFIPYSYEGLPCASINRVDDIDPYYGSTDMREYGIAQDIEEYMSKLTMADIDLKAYKDGNEIHAKSYVKFMRDYQNANFRVGYMLIANGMRNKDWHQVNLYSNRPTQVPASSPLQQLVKMPNPVDTLTFNDIAVDGSAVNGVVGSLPSQIVTLEEYTNEYTFNIAANKLIQTTTNFVNPDDPRNLEMAAFVIDMNTKHIVNAIRTSIGDTPFEDEPGDGVEGISVATQVIGEEYYDFNGRKVINPSKGIFIVKEKLSDGTFRTKKVAK